eukprot:TRINITY_DN9145_c0_g1_i1.p1 TRINITY_DN9145_c0_g1~~TRINITY_DN9145_c0_g1_i1.p1  ORF type:complete len:1168 (-),score=419.89 TRINITY_DN9145_c0_g1_i1:218-3721(-)
MPVNADKAESKLVAAVSDKRLRGRDEAVYYILRGMGMPVLYDKHDFPRIEVVASKYKALFVALKRLGIRSDGATIIVEPRPQATKASEDASPDLAGSDAASMLPSLSAPNLHGGSGFLEAWATMNQDSFLGRGNFVRSADARRLGRPLRPHRRPAREPPDADDIEDLYRRLQAPKPLQKKGCMVEAVKHDHKLTAAMQARRAQQEAHDEVQRQAQQRHLEEMGGDPLQDPSQQPTMWDRIAKPPARIMTLLEHREKNWQGGTLSSRTQQQQQVYSEQLAKQHSWRRPPVQWVTSDKWQPSRSMSSSGLAAHRSLCQRLAAVQDAGGFPWRQGQQPWRDPVDYSQRPKILPKLVHPPGWRERQEAMRNAALSQTGTELQDQAEVLEKELSGNVHEEPPAKTAAELEEERRRALQEEADRLAAAKEAEEAAKRKEEEARAAEEAAAAEAALEAEVANFLPDAKDAVQPGLFDGFSDMEFARMKRVFQRFKDPLGTDMDKDDLGETLRLLGYMYTEANDIQRISEAISRFGTIDFEEFESFASAFKRHEEAKFKTMFDQFDSDGGGQLDTEELSRLMLSLGFTPLRSMLRESLAVVDEDGSGTISFPEFVHLLSVYRYSEGFTRSEVKEFYTVFLEHAEGGDEKSSEKVVPVEAVTDMLLGYFGPQSATLAVELGKEAMAGKKKQEDQAKDAPGGEAKKAPGLPFQEALLTARRCREMEFAQWREAFNRYDADGSGALDREEVQQVICDLGYTLLRKEIDAVLQEVEEAADEDGEEDGELDYDEFVYLMQIFKQRDGFSSEELEELQEIFDKFDHDGGGEVETMELSDMLRFLGISISIEETQALLSQVDFNDSGSLDWREFLRFMRLNRENELRDWRETFQTFMDREAGLLSKKLLTMAIKKMGFSPSGRFEHDQQIEDGIEFPDMLEFDEFVVAVNRARAMWVKEQRKMAGYNNVEFTRFEDMFNDFDADRSGTIEAKEVGALLESLGFTMRTKEERDTISRQIEEARQVAKEAGIDELGLGGNVTIWVLVQLLRILYNIRDSQLLDREKEAVDETKFTAPQVKQFREIFMNWVEQEKTYEAEALANGIPIAQSPKAKEGVKELSKEAMRRLFVALGIKLMPKQAQEMDSRALKIAEGGFLDFPDFLRTMRWMVEESFSNVASVFGLA